MGTCHHAVVSHWRLLIFPISTVPWFGENSSKHIPIVRLFPAGRLVVLRQATGGAGQPGTQTAKWTSKQPWSSCYCLFYHMETPAVRDKLSTAFRVQPVISARIFSFIVPAIGFQPFLLVRLDNENQPRFDTDLKAPRRLLAAFCSKFLGCVFCETSMALPQYASIPEASNIQKSQQNRLIADFFGVLSKPCFFFNN